MDSFGAWITGNMDVVIWLALAVVLLIFEGVTTQLVCIWFCIGAFAAAAVGMFGAPLWLQFVAFVAVSLVALIFTRRFVTGVLRVEKTPTNADSVIGMVGVVTTPIDNITETGRVLVNGMDWSARSAGSDKIEKDCQVKILEIRGVKLIVEPQY